MTRIHHRRGIGIVLLSIFSLLGAALVAASPAHADTMSTRTEIYRQGYNKTQTVRFHDPNICVKVQQIGVITFRANVTTWKRTTSSPGTTMYAYSIDQVSLGTNSVKITATKASGSSCTATKAPWREFDIWLKIRAYSCDYNPSISIGAPWSVGLSFWPDCGDRNLAKFHGHAGQPEPPKAPVNTYTVNRTDDVVKFSGYQEAPKWYLTKQTNLPKWGCYAAATTLRPQYPNAEDEKSTPRIAVCPFWGGGEGGW